MIDVRTLDELGVPVPLEQDGRPWESGYYESLAHEIQDSPDGVAIDEIRQRPYGIC